MKKFLSLILALGMVASLAACGGSSSSGDASSDSSTDSSASAPAASAKLRFVTGGESGTYYAFGSVIAQHATNNTNVAVTGLVGNGSQANVESHGGGRRRAGLLSRPTWALTPTTAPACSRRPARWTDFSTVANLYMEQVQIVTLDRDIKSVADLAGKNVSVGASGSGVYFNAVDVLSAYRPGRWRRTSTPPTSPSATAPSPCRTARSTPPSWWPAPPPPPSPLWPPPRPSYLVSLDDEHIDKLLADSPYYSKTTRSPPAPTTWTRT